MLAVFHLPLTDLRPFVDEPTGRVANPGWPIVNLPDEPYKRPFVRGFGPARERWRGGVDEWSGEDFYCDLSGAVRLAGPVLKSMGPRAGLKRYSAFRRLFWDGQFLADGSVVGRAEFGFAFNIDRDAAPFTGPEMAAALDGVLRQSVLVAAPQGAAKPQLLSHCGSALAAAYLNASTTRVAPPEAPPPAWWLTASTPLLVVEGRQGVEVDSWPAPARGLTELPVLAGARIRVFSGRRKLEGRDRPVWYFECDRQGFHNRDVLRRLRLNVTRLHSALATLRVLADLQAKGRLAPRSPEARQRLAAALGLYLPFLYRSRQQGLDLPPFVAAALAMEEALTPAMFASLRALVPAPGRGLADQLDRAEQQLPGLQPAPEAAPEWDLFIAHAGPDLPAATALFDAVADRARVYLDQKRLLPGNDWDLELARAQRRSRMTVVLVGADPDSAYYLRSEIAAAISMARIDGDRHRVVPVYLLGEAGRRVAAPYGLNLKHGLALGPDMPWTAVADRLLDTLAQAAAPGPTPASTPSPAPG